MTRTCRHCREPFTELYDVSYGGSDGANMGRAVMFDELERMKERMRRVRDGVGG